MCDLCHKLSGYEQGSSRDAYTEDELIALADEILNVGERTGVYQSFSYIVEQNKDATLVVFIDNTIENQKFFYIN